MLNCNSDDSLLEEGLTREIINRVQTLRKSCNLFQTKKVTAHLQFVTENSALANALEKNQETIESATNISLVKEKLSNPQPDQSARWKIKDDELELSLVFSTLETK